MKYRIVEQGGKFTPQYQTSFMVFWTQWVNIQPYTFNTFERALEQIGFDKLRNAPDPKPIIHYIE